MVRTKIKEGDLPPEFLTHEEIAKRDVSVANTQRTDNLPVANTLAADNLPSVANTTLTDAGQVADNLQVPAEEDAEIAALIGKTKSKRRRGAPGVEKLHNGIAKQDANHIGRYDGTKGYWKYRYNKAMTPRMKVLSGLLSFGMSQKEILSIQKIKATAHNTTHTCMAAKDEQIVARVEANIDEMVEQAKTIIQKSSVKAAENFQEAVQAGDLKASGKVLEFCGAFRKQSDVNINMTFGSWLKTTQEDRALNEIDITPGVSAANKEKADA